MQTVLATAARSTKFQQHSSLQRAAVLVPLQFGPLNVGLRVSGRSLASRAGSGKGKGKPELQNKPDPRKSFDRRFEVRQPYLKEANEDSPEVLMQSKMYMPESLKSEGLALNCKRMVDFGLAVPELLDRYGQRATELAPGLKPSEYSRILNAFAKASHRHDKMLAAFTKNIPSRLYAFLPPDLSSVCNAYAKFRHREEALFRRFSLEMPHKLPQFEAHELRNIANAYARLSIRDDLLFDDIADEVAKRPQDFDGTGLVIIANAFAHFKIRKPNLWHAITQWLMETYLDLAAKDVALALNALSAVEFRQEQLIRTLLTYLADGILLEELEPGGASITLNALARLKWASSDEQVAKIVGRTETLMDRYDAREVTQLLHACTRLPSLAQSHSLVRGLLARAQQHLKNKEFNAQALSLLAYCCASLKQRDVALLTMLAKVIPDKLSDFTPQGLAMVVSGYSRLDVRSEILFYLLAQEIVEKMPLFTGQGVGIVLNGYGRLNIKNERLVLACRKQVRNLAEELSLTEIQRLESGFKALDALDERTESMLQRMRQEVAATHSTLGAPSDPWVDEEERLLRRLAEEAPEEPSAEAHPPQVPRSARWNRGRRSRHPAAEAAPSDNADSSDGPGREGAHGTEGNQEDEAKRVDLWSLWGPGASVSGEEATSSQRLREYLARPEHMGRLPIAVDKDSSLEEPPKRFRRRRMAAAIHRQQLSEEDRSEGHGGETKEEDHHHSGGGRRRRGRSRRSGESGVPE